MRRQAPWAPGASRFFDRGIRVDDANCDDRDAVIRVRICDAEQVMNTPLIIAHRAQSTTAPENARSALLQAAADGADLIELDVRLTLDRKPVIHHDFLLGRTTSGHGPVSWWPSPLLRRFHMRHAADREPLADVSSMLDIAPATTQLAFHLKHHRALGTVLREIRRHEAAGRCWLWLERMEDVYVATRELPELRCTLLRPGSWTPVRRGDYFHDAQAAGARAVSVPVGAITPELVHHAHQHHLWVFSRIDHPELLPQLIENGLDGAITAHTREAFAVLQSLGFR
jgi:glycerophosphoryl diester phosphodiesterase